jgi:glucosamine-6-phosphate deaminase
MEVIIRSDKESATALAANIIADYVKRKPTLILGLATGRTMEELYDKLAIMNLDFTFCKSFNLDEYLGIEPANKNSYRYYMNKHLFEKININIKNTYLPDGTVKNTVKSCKEYENLIIDNGGIDLQLLGIGRSGHIGFNEPLSALRSRTREKALTPTTVAQNSPLFDNPEDMPKRALTMGVGTILEAKRIIMLVTGREKADILAKAVEGPITSMISATALQLHPTCTVIVDEDAAEKLQEREYYRWIFENEPEWEPYRVV